MSVGILTYHNNENKGAILQAWSLAKALDNRLPENMVEVVDYRTRSKEFKRFRSAILPRNPFELPIRFADWRQCQRFIREGLPVSEEKIVTDDLQKAVTKLNGLEYDLLVVGSDEVWKVAPGDSGNLLSPKRPFPNLYFLDSAIDAPKVSYAASANKLIPESLSAEQYQGVMTRLQDFDLLSVRDNHTEQLLNDSGIEEVYRVPDPTIMVDIPTREVESILQNHGIDPTEKILGIHGSHTPVFNQVARDYRAKGFQVVSMTSSAFADINLLGRVDPFEYYSMYAQFDMVVTNSLHSTIFSIKHGTPFATVDTAPIYRTVESKTHSLLEEFGMLERHVDATAGDVTGITKHIERVERPIDLGHRDARIADLQANGNDFIDLIVDIYEAND